jgi:acyl-CoA reductase-like NAD-dependent aldehyde dehydrogenase
MSARLPVTKTHKLYINGAFPRSESGRSIDVTDAGGKNVAHACLASRKDLRDAVRAAGAAQGAWSARSAYNRGQILYRMGEMLEGKQIGRASCRERV